ncbi:flagellar hook-basal body complex protein FliE [Aeromonas rivuli]|jgi:flagellar hook-basal body complex protein FliE|uniref:flagellar hook-basal body complex protein FliE n=1 Tax=Aeromonas TaxID=642 RepID=UPI0005A9E4FE|nr:MULTISPECIES: flagellar hook-basal body complex protein FliE [Aeromonas]MCS3455325.1 flagellar hook-basal body complex protein FliE [Aeromonas sp. BIGb0405]UBO72939.1 flagellar hook-basal body complex protein FliE [Aeromonas rivuli]
MEISASSLMQEMQALKVEAGIPAVSQPSGHVSSDFGQLLQQALGNVNGLQGTANDLRTRLDMGDKSVDLSDVMIAGQKASIAFEATVQVRNKMVDAYKTIMNMPV